MFPEGFRSRISTQVHIDPEALFRALEEPSPVSIRVNHSKWNRNPAGSKPVPWASGGYYIDSRPSYTLDPLFHGGCYYPQEASSMILEEVVRQVVNVSEQLCVLDLCGAPGGKSTHLSDLIGKNSLLVANDVIKPRAMILAETLTKWGAGNVIVTQSDPSAFGRIPAYFDVILVDAPCSGEGMFRTQVARNEWSEAGTVHCAERQRRILDDVWTALKENGLLIYSTCTFNPGENEENIKWLVENRDAESVKLNISSFKGITEINLEGISGYAFYPYRSVGEGFFISVIRKRNREQILNQKNHKTDDLILVRKEVEGIKNWTSIPEERYLKWGDDIWGLPCSMEEYKLFFQKVKIVKAGTRICTVKGNDFLPAPDLALSAELNSDAFPSGEVSYDDAIAFLRRDNMKTKFDSRGWNIVKYSGINLGWANNIGNRINNYFPVGWRIRMTSSVDANIIKWE